MERKQIIGIVLIATVATAMLIAIGAVVYMQGQDNGEHRTQGAPPPVVTNPPGGTVYSQTHVPTKPVNLIAVNPSTMPERRNVSLTWQAPLDDGALTITEYRIYHSQTPGAEGLIGYLTVIPGQQTMHYDDSTARKNGANYYVVTAVNSKGVGEASDEYYIMIYNIPVPSVPMSTTGKLIGSDGSQWAFTWIDPVDDGGYPITGYILAWCSNLGTLQGSFYGDSRITYYEIPVDMPYVYSEYKSVTGSQIGFTVPQNQYPGYFDVYAVNDVGIGARGEIGQYG